MGVEKIAVVWVKLVDDDAPVNETNLFLMALEEHLSHSETKKLLKEFMTLSAILLAREGDEISFDFKEVMAIPENLEFISYHNDLLSQRRYVKLVRE